MPSPLEGVVVVEACGAVAARYCGKLFAAHGATVLRTPTAVKQDGLPGSKAGRAYAAWLDEGKRPAEADLPGALTQAASVPHLVIAGLSPPDVDAAAQAIAAAPGPLLLGLTWFGHSGPYRDWLGSDALIHAMTGIAYPFGEAAGPPTLPQGHAPQMIAGVTAYLAAVAGLAGRRRGGSVRRVDVNVFEAHLCFTESGVAARALGGPASLRRGVNRFTPTYPASSYPTAEGWLGITALTPPQWRALCELVGLPALAADPRLATAEMRLERADAVDAALGPALLKRTAAEWLALGQARRIPLAPLPTPAEVLRTPHWQMRGSFAPVRLGAEEFLAPALPYRLRPVQAGEKPAARVAGSGLLGDVRVLDLTMGWAGPLATRHLADLGAQVIKVESCSHMDWWRGWEQLPIGGPPTHEMRPAFALMNRNKRAITLELRKPAGLDVAKALAAQCDLVIENFAPGVLGRLGLPDSALRRENPGLVTLSMGAFGSHGPWSAFHAYGSTTEQACGLPWVNGQAGWPPCIQHVAYGDAVAGLYAAAVAVTALFGRIALGGAEVDLSQVECLFQLGAQPLIAAAVEGGQPARTGSRRPGVVPCGCFPAQAPDTWVAVAAETDAHWRALCGVLEQEAWLGRSRAAIEEATIEAELTRWTRQYPAAQAAALLRAAGVPAAQVAPTSTLLEDEHLRANGIWHWLERRHLGRHLVSAAPYRIDGARPPLGSAAPTLGEHNVEVLTGVLGLTDAEIGQLLDAKVIGFEPRPD